MKFECCVIIIKPDAVKRALVGEILTRFERAGMRILQTLTLPLGANEEEIHEHYKKLPKNIRDAIVNYFCGTRYDDGGFVPFIVILVYGSNAIAVCRKLAGATQCSEALPGTIRGDFGNENYNSREGIPEIDKAIRNLVHVSDSPEESERESKIWFQRVWEPKCTGN